MDRDRDTAIGAFHPDMIALTPNRFTNQYLAAAAQLGLDAEPMRGVPRTWMIAGRGRRLAVRAAVLGCNNPLAIRMSADKYLTHLLMDGGGIAMPACEYFVAAGGRHWDTLGAKAKHWAGARYPVVVKSATGSGAKNVYVDIENDGDLEAALRAIRLAGVERFLVEEQLSGTLYRVTAFDGEIIGALAKFPGAVVGDGRATIRELVRVKDGVRRACGQRPIPLRRQVVHHLRKRGLDLQSVLPAGVEQTLTAEISGRLGCRREPVPLDALPDSARAHFRRAAAVAGLRWVGFDYFCDDILDPERAQRGCFNEINSAPTPTEFVPGMGRAAYLRVATTVLARYFDVDPAAAVAA